MEVMGVNHKMPLAPDLDAEVKPGSTAAGFALGGDFYEIQERFGQVEWCDADASLEQVLLRNKEWIGVVSKVGSALGGNKTVQSFVYKNSLVTLEFGDAIMLFRIILGRGYRGKFGSVVPGDDVSLLSKELQLDFNDMDDEFLLIKDGRYVEGISVLTDCRVSLDHRSDQRIEYISVHNWSLR